MSLYTLEMLNTKKCKYCWKEFTYYNSLEKYCSLECKKLNGDIKPLKRTKISPIWKIRKRRVKEKWSEFNLFKEIAIERAISWFVTCVKCWKKIKLENLTISNFDHEKPKSWWVWYRLDKNNIRIKCFHCHFKKTHWLNLKVEYRN